MTRPLKTLLSYLFTAVLSALVVALPPVYPLIVTLVAYLLTAVLTVAALCASGALVALTWFWTRHRMSDWQTTDRLDAATAQFASDMQAVAPAPMPADTHGWRVAYLQIAFIAHSKGSFSFSTLAPYFETNARRYWDWMKAELMRAGWVENRGRRVGMVFCGSYRRFSAGLRMGAIELLPCPDLSAPRVRWVTQAANTPGTLGTVNTLTH